VRRLSRIGLAFALLVGAAIAAPAEVQKRTLLSSDGTLYTLATGLASEVGVAGSPQDFVIAWSSVAQDGKKAGGTIPGTASANPKTSLDLTLDEPTGTLVVLWREESSVLNAIRVAFKKESAWTVVNLLPSNGFPHAFNPQMLLTHQTVHLLDDNGDDVYRNRSILSVVWWEEAGASQARYASFFLDEAIDATQAAVYNLPDLVDDAGPTSLAGLPRGAYAFPALQSAGPGGDVLASFATVSSNKQYVVRISYSADLGQARQRTTTRGCGGASRSSASRAWGRSPPSRRWTWPPCTPSSARATGRRSTGATAPRCTTSGSTARPGRKSVPSPSPRT
jgi:hypothetical protein